MQTDLVQTSLVSTLPHKTEKNAMSQQPAAFALEEMQCKEPCLHQSCFIQLDWEKSHQIWKLFFLCIPDPYGHICPNTLHLRNNQAICCHGGSSSYRAWGRVDCHSYEFHHVSRETIESLGLCPKVPLNSLFCPWFLTIVPSRRMPRQTCGPWRKRWPFMLEVHNLMQQHRACWMHWAWKLAHRTACRRSYSFDISICI